MVPCDRSDAVDGFDTGPALVNALLIAIPLWVILGVVLALVFQHGTMEEAGSAALMIAAVCEAILLRPLLRPYLRKLRAGIRRYADFRRMDSRRDAGARRARPAHSLFRQALTLSALVGAYLQYYFLEVALQIASLHSLTVFVPVTSTT